MLGIQAKIRMSLTADADLEVGCHALDSSDAVDADLRDLTTALSLKTHATAQGHI